MGWVNAKVEAEHVDCKRSPSKRTLTVSCSYWKEVAKMLPGTSTTLKKKKMTKNTMTNKKKKKKVTGNKFWWYK